MKNKALITLVGLVLIAIGLVGCSDSGSAASHGTYAYIPNDSRNNGWERVEVKKCRFHGDEGIQIETTDGRTIEGYNITIVKE